MDAVNPGFFLVTGLAWGLLHAFDPDHVAAVVGVSAGDQQQRPVWQFALRWSFGHGSAMACLAAAVLIFGRSIPSTLSHLAEQSIAYVLIAMGLLAVARCAKMSVFESLGEISRQKAIVVGLIHGVAGSAPLLALIPLTQVDHPALAFLYVLFFSAGVLLAMTSFSSLLSVSVPFCSKISFNYSLFMRVCMAFFSIGVGIYLIVF